MTQADHVLSLAATVSGIMLVMAFRGWIFWLVNVGLAVYLFTQTFKIYDYNQLRRKVRSFGSFELGDVTNACLRNQSINQAVDGGAS